MDRPNLGGLTRQDSKVNYESCRDYNSAANDRPLLLEKGPMPSVRAVLAPHEQRIDSKKNTS